MNSKERSNASIILASTFGPDRIIELMATREAKDPRIAQKKKLYTDQAEHIIDRLKDTSLTPRQKIRLEWNLKVLQYRAEHGPVIHSGFYTFNLLPRALASTNPQQRNFRG